jgi:hypothetical protein
MNTEFMLRDLTVDFVIELAIISENSVHFFELLDHKIALLNDGFHCYPTTHKHLIDRYEFLELRVVDLIFELFDLVLQRNH